MAQQRRTDAKTPAAKQPPGPRGPQKVGDLVATLLARRGYAREQAAANYETAWKEAAGENLAKHSRPCGVRGGVLEVIVRNSTMLQELTFSKRGVVQKLAQLLPAEKIKDLKFRVGVMD